MKKKYNFTNKYCPSCGNRINSYNYEVNTLDGKRYCDNECIQTEHRRIINVI